MKLRKKLLKYGRYMKTEVYLAVLFIRLLFWRRFKYDGQSYKYCVSPQNSTYSNERTVEVPIIKRILNSYKGKKILEVGNVMCRYLDINYDVLDKYEPSSNVNYSEDICTFKSKSKYDLIISISTLEHVGFDEKGESSSKVLGAFSNIITMTKSFVCTIPLAYNNYLDNLIFKGKIKDVKFKFMRKKVF